MVIDSGVYLGITYQVIRTGGTKGQFYAVCWIDGHAQKTDFTTTYILAGDLARDLIRTKARKR